MRGSESGFESDLHIRKWDKAIENCADSLAARPPVVGDIARPGGQGTEEDGNSQSHFDSVTALRGCELCYHEGNSLERQVCKLNQLY